MSIKTYTNFDNINKRTDNEVKYISEKDFAIISKNQIEYVDFGECGTDVMEVSVYDVNNNLLPQKSGNKVAYIKTSDIKNYLYQITNKGGQKELAIDIEKLLNTIGFTNGIFKVNINFVRNSVGTDNELTRVWIHEISPSREEIRVVPLKVTDKNITTHTKKQFDDLVKLNADFKYYKKNILDSLDLFETKLLTKIDDMMVNKFGNDFISILRNDFGIRDFQSFRTRIFENFRDSIHNWLNNRYYDITQSNFGKKSEERFDDCDKYDFTELMTQIQSILNNCISFNIKRLKRRSVEFNQLPKEFAIVELRKQIQDNLNTFNTYNEVKRNVFTSDSIDVNIGGVSELPPIVEVVDKKITLPAAPLEPQPTPVLPPTTGGSGGGMIGGGVNDRGGITNFDEFVRNRYNYK